MELKKLDELIELARNRKKRKLAIAAAQDIHVLQAIHKASIERLLILSW